MGKMRLYQIYLILKLEFTKMDRGKKVSEKNFVKKLESSLKMMKKDEVIEALNNLKLVEGELETLVKDGSILEPELIISFLHNIGYCYQQLGELEESASYIEASIFNAEKKYLQGKSKSKNDGYYSSKIKPCSYLSNMYASLCIVMSGLENHCIALVHAKKSLEYASAAIKNTVKAAGKGILHAASAQKIRQKIYMVDPKKKKIKPTNTLGILTCCNKLVLKSEVPQGLIKLNTLEGFRADLKETLTLNSAMKMKSLSYYKLKTLTNVDFEAEPDEVFRKIYNVIVALYLISTESTLMEDKEQAIRSRNKAVTIARTFLPNDCEIISQIQYLDE